MPPSPDPNSSWSTSGTLPGAATPPSVPPSNPMAPPAISNLPETNLKDIPKLLKATYLTQGERLLYEARPTRWLFLVAPTLVFILVAIVDLFLLRNFSSALNFFPSVPAIQGDPGTTLGSIDLIVAVLLVLMAVIFFGIRWIYYARTVYVVTSTRIIRQKGILAKDFDEVQLIQVRGVDVRQHVLARILRFGTVRISAEFGGASPNAMGNEDWLGVVRPMEFERLVETAQEKLRGYTQMPPGAR